MKDLAFEIIVILCAHINKGIIYSTCVKIKTREANPTRNAIPQSPTTWQKNVQSENKRVYLCAVVL